MENIFQEKYYNEDLLRFLDNIWENPAEYKVMMARRMLNLNYALMHEMDMGRDNRFLTSGIMSNTAFLLSAPVIADRYAYKKEFPRIVVCDDIMLHGRGVINLIDKFKKIVTSCLKDKHVEISSGQLEKDLYKALSIQIFARSEDEKLLFNKDKYLLYAAHILPVTRLRSMSAQISGFLQNSGVANTSYVLSAELPRYLVRLLDKDEGADLSWNFRYKEKSLRLFLRDRSSRIIETIRLSYADCGTKRKYVLTSLPLFGDLSEPSFNVLCSLVADYMEQNVRYSQVAFYLRREEKELAKEKTQLLSFLYSILSMTEFCKLNLHIEGKELYRTLVSGDFNKIISNFDTGEVFRYEILSLFRDCCMHRTPGSELWDYLDYFAQDLLWEKEREVYSNKNSKFTAVNSLIDTDRTAAYENFENIIYEVGLDAEYGAYRYIRTNTEYDPAKPGFDVISFKQYMYIMNRKDSDIGKSIGCLFCLMDCGLVSMNSETIGEENGQKVRTVLKAGEMATYILPERFMILIPALAYVERHFMKSARNIREVMGTFIDYVQNYCYRQDRSAKDSDRDVLEALKRNKSLLLYMYSGGQTFQDWDMDFGYERKNSNGQYLLNEKRLTYNELMDRRRYYLEIARKFVNEYAA